MVASRQQVTCNRQHLVERHHASIRSLGEAREAPRWGAQHAHVRLRRCYVGLAAPARPGFRSLRVQPQPLSSPSHSTITRHTARAETLEPTTPRPAPHTGCFQTPCLPACLPGSGQYVRSSQPRSMYAGEYSAPNDSVAVPRALSLCSGAGYVRLSKGRALEEGLARERNAKWTCTCVSAVCRDCNQFGEGEGALGDAYRRDDSTDGRPRRYLPYTPQDTCLARLQPRGGRRMAFTRFPQPQQG